LIIHGIGLLEVISFSNDFQNVTPANYLQDRFVWFQQFASVVSAPRGIHFDDEDCFGAAMTV
jgi:hypothetical protein